MDKAQMQDILADHESRLGLLEGLHTPPDSNELGVSFNGKTDSSNLSDGGSIPSAPANKQIEQLRSMVLYLQKKLNEHLDKSKGRKQRRVII